MVSHNASGIEQAEVIVHSSADNEELAAARNDSKTVLHRSGIPDEVMSDKYVMAVSGSSGTTMAASFLITVTLMQL